MVIGERVLVPHLLSPSSSRLESRELNHTTQIANATGGVASEVDGRPWGPKKVPHRRRGSRTRRHIPRSPQTSGRLAEETGHLPRLDGPPSDHGPSTTHVTSHATGRHPRPRSMAPGRTSTSRAQANDANGHSESLRDATAPPPQIAQTRKTSDARRRQGCKANATFAPMLLVENYLHFLMRRSMSLQPSNSAPRCRPKRFAHTVILADYKQFKHPSTRE